MQNGPFGITSRATIFMAAYRTILTLHLEFESLDGTIPRDLLDAVRGKKKKDKYTCVKLIQVF